MLEIILTLLFVPALCAVVYGADRLLRRVVFGPAKKTVALPRRICFEELQSHRAA
ncbi:MAG: hypothetical protein IJY82_02885 [Oscillospiraceae bacterium]|nr:hypothetical protein [Oscillospiraceae bacterium]